MNPSDMALAMHMARQADPHVGVLVLEADSVPDHGALLRALQAPVESAKEAKKRADEAMAAGTLGALLRADSKTKKVEAQVTDAAWSAILSIKAKAQLRESATVDMAALVGGVPESAAWIPPFGICGRIPVVLICEGLGNSRDKNYYGPEAMEAAVRTFEGKPMFFDHPGEAEMQDRPERSVKDKVGFYKDLVRKKVQRPDDGRMVDGVCGWVYFEASQAGRLAYDKAITAIEYRKMFPNSRKEYVGLSINAGGEAEERTLTLEGRPVEVNYITDLDGVSVDMVTDPARGGRFLARESNAGAHVPSNEEDRMKLMESIEAAHAAVQAAENEKDPAVAKTKLTEAAKALGTLIVDAKKAVKEANDAMEADRKAKEAADAAAAEEAKKKEADEKAAKEAAAKAAEGKFPKKGEKEDDEEEKDKKESRRLAVTHLVSEAGVDADLVDIDDMVTKPIAEAKAKIAQVKKLQEAANVKALGGAPAGTVVVKEAAVGSMDGEFSRCTQ